ncbi:hypothetical protein Tco_1448626 [Tanacetum coccineum]
MGRLDLRNTLNSLKHNNFKMTVMFKQQISFFTDIWDRVKMLMKGNELSYQERECRLYNLFDKFAYVQGETLKFVTDVKLAKSLYTINYDQLYAYLIQHEQHVNEVRSLMYPPPQQFTPVYAAPIHHQHHHTLVNPQQHPVSPPTFISPLVTQQSQDEFPQLDSTLVESGNHSRWQESQFNKFKEDNLRVLLALEIEELLQLQGKIMHLVNQEL